MKFEDLKQTNLTKNLYALRDFQQTLLRLIDAYYFDDKFRLFLKNELINAEFHLGDQIATFHGPEYTTEISNFYKEWLDVEGSALILGIGLGYGLSYLLKKSTISRFYVYERDLSLLKAALTLNDFASEIISQRLILIEQAEIPTLADRHIKQIICEPVMFDENKLEFFNNSTHHSKREKYRQKEPLFYLGRIYLRLIALRPFSIRVGMFLKLIRRV